MNIRKAPALLLALALQVLPLCRVATVNTTAAPTGFAIVMRWLAGAAALLGSYHAVSGASAAITGLAPINSSGIQTGPVTTSAVGTVGKPFMYRIVVSNPGTDHAQDFWNCFPLPPGLGINTNIGGNGWITNAPTTAGVFSQVTLLAGNANCSCFVTMSNITITISGGSTSPPQITAPPANQTVSSGTNATFTVTATGTAPLSYSWTFNGTPIAAATTSRLQLSNVKTTDSGTYSVTVTNTAGSKSASATLTVNAATTAPSIATQPQSLTITNGSSAEFSVTASGTDPLNYQWFKDTTPLPIGTNSTFSLASASTNDIGNYSVVISNSAGSVTSAVAILSVLLPPLILTPPQSQSVSNGATANFSVTVSGSEPVAYQWKFNGNDLSGATASSLTITNVQSVNQGDYTVVVSNAVAALTSPAAHLTVQSATPASFQLGNWQIGNGSLAFDILGPGQTNYVIWSSADLTHWTAVRTNFSSNGTVHFSEPNVSSTTEFYRASLSP